MIHPPSDPIRQYLAEFKRDEFFAKAAQEQRLRQLPPRSVHDRLGAVAGRTLRQAARATRALVALATALRRPAPQRTSPLAPGPMAEPGS